MWFCEDKLKGKTAHFRLPSASQKRACLSSLLSVWTNLGKHLLFVWLCASGINTGTRRIIRLDELSFVVRLERHTTKDYSSTRLMLPVPVVMPGTQNQTNNKCLPKFVPTDNASYRVRPVSTLHEQHERRIIRLDGLCVSCIKTAIVQSLSQDYTNTSAFHKRRSFSYRVMLIQNCLPVYATT